jgi:Spy/CpxP family protein refolding chaperone
MQDKHLRLWFVVFVLAVFMAGVGGGSILDRYLGRGGPRNPAGGPRRAGGPGGPGGVQMARRLATDLDLTSAQQAELDAILARRRQRIEQVQGEVQARFEAEQREMRDEIAKILTPDQRKKFEGWLNREPFPGMWRMPGPGMGRGRGMGGGPGRGRGPGPGGF